MGADLAVHPRRPHRRRRAPATVGGGAAGAVPPVGAGSSVGGARAARSAAAGSWGGSCGDRWSAAAMATCSGSAPAGRWRGHRADASLVPGRTPGAVIGWSVRARVRVAMPAEGLAAGSSARWKWPSATGVRDVRRRRGDGVPTGCPTLPVGTGRSRARRRLSGGTDHGPAAQVLPLGNTPASSRLAHRCAMPVQRVIVTGHALGVAAQRSTPGVRSAAASGIMLPPSAGRGRRDRLQHTRPAPRPVSAPTGPTVMSPGLPPHSAREVPFGTPRAAPRS